MSIVAGLQASRIGSVGTAQRGASLAAPASAGKGNQRMAAGAIGVGSQVAASRGFAKKKAAFADGDGSEAPKAVANPGMGTAIGGAAATISKLKQGAPQRIAGTTNDPSTDPASHEARVKRATAGIAGGGAEDEVLRKKKQAQAQGAGAISAMAGAMAGRQRAAQGANMAQGTLGAMAARFGRK